MLKAYSVQGDENGEIVFAEQAVVARRNGANMLDSEFEYVSCRRAPGGEGMSRRVKKKLPPKPDLPYLVQHFSRHGKVQLYFRHGATKVRIYEKPGSPEFLAVYKNLKQLPWLPKHTPVPQGQGRPSYMAPQPKLVCKRKRIRVSPTDKYSEMDVVYFIQSRATKNIKIGFSSNVAKRLEALATSSSERLVLLGVIPGTVLDEKELHRRFSEYRVHGEWFENAPSLVDHIENVVVERLAVATRNHPDEIR